MGKSNAIVPDSSKAVKYAAEEKKNQEKNPVPELD